MFLWAVLTGTLLRAQEYREPIRFEGAVVSVSTSTNRFVVRSGSETLKLLPVAKKSFAFRQELNGCPGASLGMLEPGDHLEGGFDPETKEVTWWAATKRRNRVEELNRGVEGCVTGGIVSIDIPRRVLILSGKDGGDYKFHVGPELEIWCHGDLSIRRKFERLPKGMSLLVRYLPREPQDVANEVIGLYCGGR